MHLIRPNPAQLDPWFLVGFLAASADIGQLEVLLLPLGEQQRYAAAFRRLRYLKTATARFTSKVASLTTNLTAGLTVGEIRPEAQTG